MTVELCVAPTRAAQRLAHAPGFVWLDAHPRAGDGRSYLAAFPDRVITVPAAAGSQDPFAPLEDLQSKNSDSAFPEWIGFVSYDAGLAALGLSGQVAEDIPLVHFARYPAVAVVEPARGGDRVSIVGSKVAVERLAGAISSSADQEHAPPRLCLNTPPAEAHRQAIAAALHHIREGDIYQVNLARRWEGRFEGHPLQLYLAMREASPVPMGAYLDFGSGQILSSSMETFVRWNAEERRLLSRPIKGTVHRSTFSEEQAALRGSDKERAEHNMIIDLMRNDLGRIADVGSVRVTDHFAVERYAKLTHLVSTVEGRRRSPLPLATLLRATFPPGSVTGTPKRRAVEIITALEAAPRGAYCGAIGMLCGNGDATFSVAIRTAQATAGRLTYHAGGGIVADSQVDQELRETELKAAVFLDAVHSLIPPIRFS